MCFNYPILHDLIGRVKMKYNYLIILYVVLLISGCSGALVSDRANNLDSGIKSGKVSDPEGADSEDDIDKDAEATETTDPEGADGEEDIDKDAGATETTDPEGSDGEEDIDKDAEATETTDPEGASGQEDLDQGAKTSEATQVNSEESKVRSNSFRTETFNIYIPED